jgi:hypothetical protein
MITSPLRVNLCRIGDFSAASGSPPIAVMPRVSEHFRVVPGADYSGSFI